MSERDCRLYLTDILDAGQAIQSYIATLDFESFRNLLIHEYFGVDLRIVWNTIQQDLPILLKATSDLLDSLEQS